ncbi:NnrS family protein [Inmirania thermothiophila]|uniref:Uncharacterized protein involved in response to NO n=1 Tax=Inmirania thermothiophila TaxID=1750597 RepID=A0A3N1XS83_9GAMM|nr:NnrS family protein [Inmirania thermothiophila]ROR29495.1 uncharacterized protein involved in response to NO [Inmirania thermothiophila]
MGEQETARLERLRAEGRVFTAAPHRVMFFGGALQLVAVAVWWAAELAARAAGTALWAPVAPAAVHGALMVLGLFPFFVFGFLMTTYPRWMGGRPVPVAAYVGAFAAMAAGVVAVYAGLLAQAAAVVAAGFGGLALGWAVALAALWRVFRTAPAPDKRYERWLNAALAAGLAACAATAVAVAAGRGGPALLAVRLALWWFLLPVLATVAHRMIPFFSECALEGYRGYRPRWSLPAINVGLGLHGLLELAGRGASTWLPDALVAAVALHHSLRWGLRRALEVRLLGVLHLAYLAFGIGMALGAADGLARLAGTAGLGRAPLHVVTVGFAAAMVIAMATRVSRGHSGRPLVMDGLEWAVFWSFEAAMVLRVVGELVPGAGWASPNLVAAGVWTLAAAAWAGRYLPVYLRPRLDGRPG